MNSDQLPRCPIHHVVLRPTMLYASVPAWACPACEQVYREHLAKQVTAPMHLSRSGVLARAHHKMELLKESSLRSGSETGELPDFSQAQIQRLANDLATMDTMRVPTVRRRRKRSWWRRLFHKR